MKVARPERFEGDGKNYGHLTPALREREQILRGGRVMQRKGQD